MRDPRSNSHAVALLATTVVMLGGLLSGSFMVVALSDHPLRDLLLFAGAMLGLALFLARLGPRTGDAPSLSLWPRVGLFGPRKKVRQYRITRAQAARPEAPRQPPSAEDVRDLKQLPNTWVPSNKR